MTRRVYAGFAALCLLSGSTWILDAWQPGALSGLERLAVHSAVAAAIFGAACLRRHPGKPAASVWGWAALLVGVPPVAIAFVSGQVDQLTIVLIFALVPVAVVFLVAQDGGGFGISESPLRLLVPALAALAGIALVLPFRWPASFAGELCFGLLLVVAGLSAWAAVRLHVRLRDAETLPSALVFAIVSCVCAASFCWIAPHPRSWSGAGVAAEAASCLLLDLPILLLTVWLLREMQPVGFAARLYLTPLVTIVEGYILLRPQAGWTTAAGILLLALGSAALLRMDSSEIHEPL